MHFLPKIKSTLKLLIHNIMSDLDCLLVCRTVLRRTIPQSSRDDKYPTLVDDWKKMHFPKRASDRGLRRGTDEVGLRAQEI